MKRLKNIPHLFGKIVVCHCIFVVTVAAAVSLYAQAKGAEMTSIYVAIAGTFVTELGLTMLKTILKKEEPPNDRFDTSD